MNKKKIIGMSLLALFSYFAYYMLTDEELSQDAIYLLKKAEPTSNLDNNVYLHLAALSNGNYESAKQEYLKANEKVKSKYLDITEQYSYPARLIEDEFFGHEFYCTFDEEGCFQTIEANKEQLSELFKTRMLKVRNFVQSFENYDFAPLSSLSFRADFEGYAGFNYLLGLSVLNEISKGNHRLAEELLIKNFSLSRKLAENSLDVISSVLFVVALQQHFQPLIEKLAESGHKFDQGYAKAFNSLSMREVSFEKTAVSEFKYIYTAVTAYLTPDDYVSEEFDSEWLIYLGYKPISTLNKMAEFWMGTKVPEGTPKNMFLTANSSKPSNKTRAKEIDLLEVILFNPRNFIGEIIEAATTPRFLDTAEDYAFGDLKLLLFKLLIKSQTTALEELLNDPQYLDPYTGNNPYLDKSKICYPGWPELADDDGNVEDTCIKLPVGR